MYNIYITFKACMKNSELLKVWALPDRCWRLYGSLACCAMSAANEGSLANFTVKLKSQIKICV